MTVPGNATKPGKLWLSSLHAFAAARAPLAPLAADDVDVDAGVEVEAVMVELELLTEAWSGKGPSSWHAA